MKNIFVLCVAATLVFCAIEPAFARGSRSGHSTSSKKSSDKGFIKKCKTAACYKKHPSGDYFIPLKKK